MRRLLFAILLFSTSAFAQSERPELAEQLTMVSKVLGETRTVLVRLPRSYATGSAAYPVIYMTDGPAHIFHTAGTIDFLAANRRMPEVILVGIGNTDRTRDLTPTHVERPQFGGQRFATSGGADRFLEFIAAELVPLIERTYRTQPYRVFLGHSFGGLFAMHAAFSRPSLFKAWIAVSPSLEWDDGFIVREASTFLEKNRDAKGTLVFSLGNEGAGNDRKFDELKRLLKRRAPGGFEWLALKLPDEDHGTTVLPTHFEGLKKVFAPWRLVINANDEPRVLPARMRDHYAALSKRVGYDVPVPEVTRNLIAYRLLQADAIDEAIELFRQNAAAYPASANVYDSLGEAYEKKGDLAQARASYARAVELGTRNEDPNLGIFKQNYERVK